MTLELAYRDKRIAELKALYSAATDVIKERGDRILELEAERQRLRDALEELVMLMEDVRTGDYKPDCLTTQPARKALEKVT